MKLREIVRVTGGRLLSGDPELEIGASSITTDSRSLKAGQFFVALKGENFDGNDFAVEALKKGARGVLVSRDMALAKPGKQAVVIVKDTLKALSRIAAYHRAAFKIPVIAVTGSNGKTTVKDMIWTVLSKKYNVLRNEGTKNNHIGVPLTLLKLNGRHDMCVLELGANHSGEIAALCRITKPTAGIITNIGPSHLEYFGSLSGVYRAKKELLDSLGQGQLAILNADDAYLARFGRMGLKIKRYGIERAADYRAGEISAGKDSIEFIVNRKWKFGIRLIGSHNVYNALAAITVGFIFDVGYNAIRDALYGFKPTYMRLELERLRGISFINDAYNSNPLSMSCALAAVSSYPAGARWVVSADMLELGKNAAAMHREIGRRIASSDIDGLITFGALSRHTASEAKRRGMDPRRVWHCDGHEGIADVLKRVVSKGDVVLLKGSRAMAVEKVIDNLR